MNRRARIFGGIFQEQLFPWFTAGLVALSSNWAAEAIPPTFAIWFSGSPGVVSPWRCGAIALFLCSMSLLYLQRHTFFKPRTRHLVNEKPEPRKHLLLFLSALRQGVPCQDGVPPGLVLTWNLDADLAAMAAHKQENPSWPWEMGLRAVRPHLGELRSVTVACSTSSVLEVGHFLAILRRYPELAGVTLRVLYKDGDQEAAAFVALPAACCLGLDFERFDELSDCVWSFLQRHHLPEQEVMIDFTGGQKVTSVVAASLTFNRRIKAQYVQTNPPWQVVSYDVIHGFANPGGLG